MTWAIRSCALAAGAAALLSAQAAYAAPTPANSIDPLVSLSVLGTQQSRAAVCAADGATTCTVPAAMASASAVSAASMAAMAQGGPPPPPKAFGMWPALLGLAVLIALMVAITQGGNNGSGDLTPISPA